MEVLPATNAVPMELLTLNQSGSISHIHTLSLPDDVRFIDRSQNNTPTATGVLVSPNSTRIIPATSSDTSIPGGLYITDVTYHPLAAIARDGNIYTLDKKNTLRYSSKDGYMAIDVVNSSTVLASIEYRIDFFYTAK